MPLTKATYASKVSWTVTNTPAGFRAASQSDSVSYSSRLDTTLVKNALAGSVTLAAGASLTVDLFAAFTDLAGGSFSATKVYGFELIALGENAKVKMEPGATDALTWFFAGTTPSLTVVAPGAASHLDGAHTTIDATHRNVKFTNTGSADLAMEFVFLVGN
jgi:hypothetical protein